MESLDVLILRRILGASGIIDKVDPLALWGNENRRELAPES